VIEADFLLAVAIPFLAGAGSTFLIERLLRPVPVIVGRPWRAVAAHLGLWALAFGIVLGITWRPYFAALLVLAELLFVVLISNAKVRALREPFVFQDFEYFTDTLKHPRLFLPYLGAGRAVVVAIVFAAVLYLGFALESSLPSRIGYPAFAVVLAVLAAAGAILLWFGTARRPQLTYDAATDLRRLGLPACLWYYALAERVPHTVAGPSRFSRSGTRPDGRDLPDIVVVQSESFFDARRLYPQIRSDLLQGFDAIRHAAVQHGCLRVPAWGGNTARTEFSFLAGLGPDEIGVHRFNPHRRLAPQGVPTVAGYLREAGYRTVCVHPYPASFYSRDAAYPALGFDRFVDLGEFQDAERFGPYVSDMAVAEKARAVLNGSTQPTLLFVITMENHGPLHLERVAPGDVQRLYAAPPPTGFDDLTIYLRHLGNADRMIRVLWDHLKASPRDAWFCWYGDHVPILPKVYEATGYADGRTDYFVWGKGRVPAAAARQDLKVEQLGALLLQHAGLLRDH
jgi:phosphoglycerol transferase MdoB-like AlkP superfamily enzyme